MIDALLFLKKHWRYILPVFAAVCVFLFIWSWYARGVALASEREKNKGLTANIDAITELQKETENVSRETNKRKQTIHASNDDSMCSPVVCATLERVRQSYGK